MNSLWNNERNAMIDIGLQLLQDGRKCFIAAGLGLQVIRRVLIILFLTRKECYVMNEMRWWRPLRDARPEYHQYRDHLVGHIKIKSDIKNDFGIYRGDHDVNRMRQQAD